MRLPLLYSTASESSRRKKEEEKKKSILLSFFAEKLRNRLPATELSVLCGESPVYGSQSSSSFSLSRFCLRPEIVTSYELNCSCCCCFDLAPGISNISIRLMTPLVEKGLLPQLVTVVVVVTAWDALLVAAAQLSHVSAVTRNVCLSAIQSRRGFQAREKRARSIEREMDGWSKVRKSSPLSFTTTTTTAQCVRAC